jgi:hypothetical protein
MRRAGPRPDALAMITGEEFWDFERASFDDELDAWRARTAAPVASTSAATTSAIAPAPAASALSATTRADSRPRTVRRDRRPARRVAALVPRSGRGPRVASDTANRRRAAATRQAVGI